MKSVRTPQLLTDLYRDLRDRRLLLPALALVLALTAVPMALSSSATPVPTVPATTPGASGPGKEAATEPAVLTRQLGFTAYRRRLERVNGQNPFRQQFTLPEVTSKLQQSSLTEPSSVATGVATSGGGSTSTSSTAGTTSTTSTSPETTTSASSEPRDDAPKPTLYTIEADLAIGPLGDLARRKSVELGKFLPSEGKAMVAFAGASEDIKHGLFLVSDDVSAVTGGGRCVPRDSTCQFLRLKVGDEAKLTYAPEGDRTYKLKLVGIELAPVNAKASDKRGKRDSVAVFAAQG
jgi:hypothetical protein